MGMEERDYGKACGIADSIAERIDAEKLGAVTDIMNFYGMAKFYVGSMVKVTVDHSQFFHRVTVWVESPNDMKYPADCDDRIEKLLAVYHIAKNLLKGTDAAIGVSFVSELDKEVR